MAGALGRVLPGRGSEGDWTSGCGNTLPTALTPRLVPSPRELVSGERRQSLSSCRGFAGLAVPVGLEAPLGSCAHGRAHTAWTEGRGRGEALGRHQSEPSEGGNGSLCSRRTWILADGGGGCGGPLGPSGRGAPAQLSCV